MATAAPMASRRHPSTNRTEIRQVVQAARAVFLPELLPEPAEMVPVLPLNTNSSIIPVSNFYGASLSRPGEIRLAKAAISHMRNTPLFFIYPYPHTELSLFPQKK